ncbi:unnamed protein product [Victoria cruziana]
MQCPLPSPPSEFSVFVSELKRGLELPLLTNRSMEQSKGSSERKAKGSKTEAGRDIQKDRSKQAPFRQKRESNSKRLFQDDRFLRERTYDRHWSGSPRPGRILTVVL